VIRYAEPSDEDGTPRETVLRVLIASRNLTFDASWDTVVRLDETKGTGSDLGPIADLFERLADETLAPPSEAHSRRVETLADSLRTARFALPSGIDEMRVHILGTEGSTSPLPESADRSLIISPFVGDDFFGRVFAPEPKDLSLVSRPESLDGLSRETLDGIGHVFAFDDGSASDPDGRDEGLSPDDPGRPIVGLHAKVFAFESGSRAQVFLGSANATGAAFSSNLELLIELTGSARGIGIDRIMGADADGPGLRDLLFRYTQEGEPPPPPPVNGADAMRRQIGRLAIEGTVEPSETGWSITYRSSEPLPEAANGETITCWPLSSGGNRREVYVGQKLDVRFEVTLETISGFLAFEVTDAQDCLTRFVVPTPLTGVPEERERTLLKLLVGGEERFLRYLLALLEDDPFSDVATEVQLPGVNGGTPAAPSRTFPVLEKLLRTMRCDPARLSGISPLVADLGADGALPEGFEEIWDLVFEIGVTERLDRV
jgi:hypothetical protein